MSFRRRMVLLAAVAVAVAVVLASVVVYVVTRDELGGQIDASLRQKLTPGLPQAVQIRTVNVSAAELAKLQREGRLPPGVLPQVKLPPGALPRISFSGQASASGQRSASGQGAAGGQTSASGQTSAGGQGAVHGGGQLSRKSSGGALSEETATSEGNMVVARGGAVAQGSPPGVELSRFIKLVLPNQTFGGATGYAQLVPPSGQVLHSEGKGSLLPVTAATRAVAAGRRGAFFSDATVAGTRVRVLTERAPEGEAWQVALPLTDVDSTLTHLKLVLAIVSLGGIALAAVLGLFVSRAALAPVRRLTGAAERVARTQDLGHRIPADEEDELGRLAASFNTMLAALERSRLAQRQLVSDASHELRTPLTSVQANLDALAIGEQLPARERARVLAAARAQLRELTVLVGDLVDLSKTEVEEVEVEDVRLDLAAAGAIERARLHAPECRFVLDAEPCLVRAAPARLERAIANLLDNACKWHPPTRPLVPRHGVPPAMEAARRDAPADGSAGVPIEVRVRRGVLEVRDHGPGIAVEDLPRVFDRFYRSPAARARPGSGLGLAIVRQVAEFHGGTVHAANDPDGGARLTLELPPLQMTDAELAVPERHEPAASGAV